jgi:hypothetical protein
MHFEQKLSPDLQSSSQEAKVSNDLEQEQDSLFIETPEDRWQTPTLNNETKPQSTLLE